MAYDAQSTYNKFQAGCGCEEEDCGCSTKNDCTCCPPGLVGVYNTDGVHVACLTPNDAEQYAINSHIPPTGYQKAFHPTTGVYIGDLTNEELIYLYQSFGTIDAPAPPGEFNPTTVESIAMAVPGQGLTTVQPVSFVIDRLTCNDTVVVTNSGAFPSGFSFEGAVASYSIVPDDSYIVGGVEIDDTVAPGVYTLTIAYTGCGNTETKTIEVTVS